MAMTGESVRVGLKKDYVALVTEGQEAGFVQVDTEDSQFSIVLPAGKGVHSDHAALPYVLDAQRFAHMPTDDRRAFLFGLMGLRTDGAAVKERLTARGCDAKKVVLDRFDVLDLKGREDLLFFFFNDTATTEIYTLSLHDALPISSRRRHTRFLNVTGVQTCALPILARQVAQLPGVSHCYLRPRSLPVWPYNLFAMLHGRSRDEVAEQAAQLAQLLGPHCRQHDILYSSAVLKKTGLRLKED